MAGLWTMAVEQFDEIRAVVRGRGEPPWATPFEPRAVFVCDDATRAAEIVAWCEESGVACTAFGAAILRFLAVADEDHACAIALRFL